MQLQGHCPIWIDESPLSRMENELLVLFADLMKIWIIHRVFFSSALVTNAYGTHLIRSVQLVFPFRMARRGEDLRHYFGQSVRRTFSKVGSERGWNIRLTCTIKQSWWWRKSAWLFVFLNPLPLKMILQDTEYSGESWAIGITTSLWTVLTETTSKLNCEEPVELRPTETWQNH